MTLRHTTRDQATHFQEFDVIFSWNEETEKKKNEKGEIDVRSISSVVIDILEVNNCVGLNVCPLT